MADLLPRDLAELRHRLARRLGHGVVSRDVAIFGACFLLSVLLRLPSFFRSVVDWDESLYLLIATQWLEGHPPYTTIWDHKPPGIYLWFALALLLFGHSVLSIRLAACLAVSVTSYSLYRIASTGEGSQGRLVGLGAAGLYLVFSLGNGGLAANTEIFVSPFVMSAAAILLAPCGSRPPLRGLLASGILLGLAISTKWVALWDGIALLLILAVCPVLFGAPTSIAAALVSRRLLFFSAATCLISLAMIVLNQPAVWVVALDAAMVATAAVYVASTSSSPVQYLRATVLEWGTLLAGVVAIVGASFLYFVASGIAGEYLEANFAANARHASIRFPRWLASVRLSSQLSSNYALWIGFLVACLSCVRARPLSFDQSRRIILVSWVLLTMPGIWITKRFYPHYFLQVTPVLCLLVPLAITAMFASARETGWRGASQPVAGAMRPTIWRSIGRARAWIPAGAAYALVALATGNAGSLVAESVVASAQFIEHRVVRREAHWGDQAASVAAYLRPRLDSRDLVYVVDYEPIVYYLLGTPLPTRYIFPAFLIDSRFSNVAGIDAVAELERIFRKDPVYVVKRERHRHEAAFAAMLSEHLRDAYELETRLGDVEVYRKRGRLHHS